MSARASTSGSAVRTMMRTRLTASLATTLVRPGPSLGWPYASLVLVAADFDGSPLLLISRLAEHTKNIAGDNRVSLLFDSSEESPDRLAGARVTVLGRAAVLDDANAKARFVRRQPEAAGYAGFGDFSLYRVAVDSAHLVGGFGRIEWIDGAAIGLDATGSEALAEGEAALVERLNSTGLAEKLGQSQGDGSGWTVTGVDPEGIDLRRGAQAARVAFPAPVRDAAAALAFASAQ